MRQLHASASIASLLVGLTTSALADSDPSPQDVTVLEALSRGTVITAEMLTGTEKEKFIGMELKRPIYPGRVLTPIDVQPPNLVRKQDTVEIYFRRGTLTVTLSGRALRDGQLGDRVPLSVRGRRTTIIGRVIAPGIVEVSSIGA